MGSGGGTEVARMGKAVVVPVGAAAGMATRETDHLVGEDLELAERGRVDQVAVRPEDRLGGVQRHAERRRPSAQRMADRAQPGQRRHGGLPAAGARDAADRPSVEIRSLGIAQILDVAERVLDNPGTPAVVGGTGHDDAVRAADPVDERPRGAGALAGLRRVHREIEVRAGEQQGLRAAALRGGQCGAEHALSAGAGPQGAADADDQRSGGMDRARAHVQLSETRSPRATCPMSSYARPEASGFMNAPARTSRQARAIGRPLRNAAPPTSASARSTRRAEASLTNVLTACASVKSAVSSSSEPWLSGCAASCSSMSAVPLASAARQTPSSMALSAASVRGRASAAPPPRAATAPRACCWAASAMPSEAEAWNSPATRLRSMNGAAWPRGNPPRSTESGSSTSSNVTELLPEARIPSASQSSCTITPVASTGTRA